MFGVAECFGGGLGVCTTLSFIGKRIPLYHHGLLRDDVVQLVYGWYSRQ